MNGDLEPMTILKRMIKYWWLMILILILGGVLGVGISRLHQPVYQSKAVITTVIDYSQLGKLDDYEEDQIFVAVGEKIGSSSVKDAVFQKVKDAGLNMSLERLDAALSLNRQDSRWILYVRFSDPQTAQQIAQYWADESMSALTSMTKDAETNFYNQQYQNSLVTCLQDTVIVDSSSSVCNLQNYAAIQSEIDRTVQAGNTADEGNSLLLLHTTYEITETPSRSDTPVLFKQSISALGGMLLALAVGLIVFSLDIPFFDRK